MDKVNGIIIILSSTLLYASLNPLIKKASDKIPPFTNITISVFVLFIVSLFLSIIFENSLSFKFASNRSSVLVLMLVGGINVGAYWLSILAYKYMPIWQQSLFTLLIPAFAGIFAYWILGETLSPKLFLGLLVMGLGLFIVVR